MNRQDDERLRDALIEAANLAEGLLDEAPRHHGYTSQVRNRIRAWRRIAAGKEQP